MRTATRTKLAEDALQIWQAGVAAVQPETLFEQAITLVGKTLTMVGTRGDTFSVDLVQVGKIWVVGGGKAGASMARGLERALGEQLVAKKLAGGILSVPEGCEQQSGEGSPIASIAGRPAGVNEPRAEGVDAARQMLRLVAEAAPDDLVICLLSGGGSALLPAPTHPITLEQKIVVAQKLSEHGATIEQLNTVRQHLSDFKGGGLARACRAGQLVTLVLSDVLGDPLPLIASGPTLQPEGTPDDAVRVLEVLGLAKDPALKPIFEFLREKPTTAVTSSTTESTCLLLANNATAVDAAGMEAERLGYSHAMTSATESEGEAEAVGQHMARMAIQMRDRTGSAGPNCLISGGEPTVRLAPAAERGLGGRNQQLALAALAELGDCQGIALLSGGTDGEDGPTDAAGACVDSSVVAAANLRRLIPKDYLQRNDAYHFFEPLQALLKTGLTHTNVCDLRVVTVQRH